MHNLKRTLLNKRALQFLYFNVHITNRIIKTNKLLTIEAIKKDSIVRIYIAKLTMRKFPGAGC